MFRLAACLAGTYFIAFATTSLVVARPDSATGGTTSIVKEVEPKRAAAKADRLPLAGKAREKRRVAEVELFGADNLMVILRDGEGQEVYRIDHASNMTIAARDAVLPQLRLHAQPSEERAGEERERDNEPERSTPQRPAGPRDKVIDDAIREEQVFACESGLSALADREAASLPRVCLAGFSNDVRKYSVLRSNR